MKKSKIVSSKIIITIFIVLYMGLCGMQNVYAGNDIVVFSQADGRWADVPYGLKADGTRANLDSSGCGILSYVNAVYYMTGNFINPADLANWSLSNNCRENGVGTKLELYKAFADANGSNYGFKYAGNVQGITKTKEHLKSGGAAIISTADHLMAVVDYDENSDKYLVLDSFRSPYRGTYPNGYRWLTASEFSGTMKIIYRIELISPLNSVKVKNPMGAIDIVEGNARSIRVRGWAFDEDDLSQALQIHVYVGGPAGSGAPGYSITADKERTDVENKFNGVGNYHGFDDVIPTDMIGVQDVYIYAINIGSGYDNTLLGVKQVTINSGYTPVGCLDYIKAGSGYIDVNGWAYDKDIPLQALNIHVFVGGPAGTNAEGHIICADVLRTDVGAVYPEAGDNHGFDARIYTNKTGTQEIYVYAISVGEGGESLFLGKREVVISEKPKVYSVESVSVVYENGFSCTHQWIENVGNSLQLYSKVYPENATNKNVQWTTSDSSILTVDANGKVTAVGKGAAYITVSTKDGGYISKCWIKVGMENIVYGDIDFNDKITATDLSVINQVVNGSLSLSDAEMVILDVDGDGKVTTADLDLVNQYIVKEIDEFPVERMLAEIKITASPQKLIYYKGEEIVTEGLAVMAIYKNGNTEYITNYSVNGNLQTSGTKKVTVSYTKDGITKTAFFYIVVQEIELDTLEIVQEMSKKSYIQGEELEFSGLKIKAKYTNGSSKIITDYQITYDESLPVGENIIEIFYQENGKVASVIQKINVIGMCENSGHIWEYFANQDIGTHTRCCTKCKTEEFQNCNLESRTVEGSDIEDGFTEEFCQLCGCSIIIDFVPRKFTIDENNVLIKYTGTDTEVMIPDYVTAIYDSAFKDCTTLANITIPDSVTSIGISAFEGCSGLDESIIIPNGVTNIGDSAFSGCVGIDTINFEGEKPNFGKNVFLGVTAEAFYSMDDITWSGIEETEDLGGNITWISHISGQCGDNLTWTLRNGTLTISGTGDMWDYDYLTEPTSPWYKYEEQMTQLVLGENITSIGKFAFYGCDGLSGELKLPDSLMMIDEYAFYNCSGFSGELKLPDDLTAIGEYAFCDCSGFSGELKLPDGLENIEVRTFYNCSGFSGKLKLPNVLESIGADAFYNCNGFGGELLIPEKVTEIGDGAFWDCSGFSGDLVIPKSVISIGEYAFYNCSGFSGELIISEKIIEIRNCAFYNCSGFSGDLVIPKNVISIGEYAFYNCSGFGGDLVIPDSVISVGKVAFGNVSGISNIWFEGNKPEFDSVVFADITAFAYYPANDVTWSDIDSTGNSLGYKLTWIPYGEEELPSTVSGQCGDDLIWTLENGTLTISGTGDMWDYSFGTSPWYEYRNSMTKLVIGESVTRIGNYAFSRCTELRGNLEIPDGVTSIGYCAFEFCSNLNGELKLPSGLRDIASYTFMGCKNLSGDLVIPSGVASINQSAFNGCSGLNGELKLPDTLISIGNSVFGSCSGLSGELKLPSSLKEIGSDAFGNCSGFKGLLVIPQEITRIGNSTFKNCTGIDTIIFEGKQPDFGENVFEGITAEANYPANDITWSDIENLQNWGGNLTWFGYGGKFYTVTFITGEGATTVLSQEIIENERVTKPANPEKEGYDFIGWKLNGTEYDFTTPVIGNLTLVAEWEIQKFIVNFNIDGRINSENVEYGKTVTRPVDPQKTGCEFKGWLLEGSIYNFITPVTRDITLTASWTIVEVPPTPEVTEYTVTFKDGETILFSNTVKKGDTVAAPTAPDKTGYKFIGWYDGEVKYNFNKAVEGALVLNAKWLDLGEIEDGDKDDLGDKEEIADKIWVAGVEDRNYTGKKLTLDIRVYDGDKKLTEKKDYTVSYKNNQNAYTLAANGKNGKYTEAAPQVIIKMKGDYKGSKLLNFQILPVDISVSGNGIAADDLYMDSSIKKENQSVKAVVTWNGKKLGKKDFTVKPETVDASKPGSYIITVKGTGNFTGERKLTFTVGTKKTDFALNKVKVTVDGKAKAKAVWVEGGVTFATDKITVTSGSTQLTLGNDYIIKGYENNDKVGNATLILEGKGNYHGQKRVTFQITGIPMSKYSISAPVDLKTTGYAYTGQEIKLLAQEGVFVHEKGDIDKKLEAGKDFTAVYSKNLNKGTASVILIGCAEAGYTGTKKITYKIAAEDVNNLKVTYANSAVFVKGGAKAGITVSHNGVELREGKDYTVTYKNNKAVTNDAKMIVKGKGNFTGKTGEISFKIIQKSLSSNDITVAVKDKEVAKNKKWKQRFKVCDRDGKVLTAMKDYKIEKYEVVSGNYLGDILTDKYQVDKSCKIQVTITAAENSGYTGTKTFTYRILDPGKDISKATIKVEDQDYNGGEVKIKALQSEELKDGIVVKYFTTAKTKTEELFHNGRACFEIVEGSYQKNDKKGTAKVTIRGIGEFGGEKTITFRIKERNVENPNNWWEDLMKIK